MSLCERAGWGTSHTDCIHSQEWSLCLWADPVGSPVALWGVACPFLLGTLSNKLFVKGNCLLICWPHHTWKIMKPTILNRFRGWVTHLPGLGHLTLFPSRLICSPSYPFNHSDNLLFQSNIMDFLIPLENPIHYVFATGKESDELTEIILTLP